MSRLMIRCVLLLVFVLLATACGNSSKVVTKTSAADTTGTTTTSSGEPTAQLRIHLTNIGEKGADIPVPAGMMCTRSIPAQCSTTLTCPPAASGQDWQGDACTYLSQHQSELFKKVPAKQACTMQFGGPERGTITGTVDGKPVAAKLERSNGCELARWDLHSPLWGQTPA